MSKLFASLKGLDFSSVIEHIGDAICVMDNNYVIHTANKRFSELYGRELQNVLGLNAHEIYPDFKKSIFFEIAEKTSLTGKKGVKIGYSMNTKRWLICRTFKYDANNFVAAIHEMSKEEETGYMNKIDALTSLGNRFAFENDLINILEMKIPFGVILIDVNRFHQINETLGFNVGDKFLMEISSRLRQAITAGNGLYRLNGDQFLALSLQNHLAFMEELKSVILSFNLPLTDNSKEFFLNSTLGYTYKTDIDDTIDSSSLLKDVEIALWYAKKTKIQYQEFNTSLMRNSISLEAETDLRKAIENDEFELFYQPQYDLKRDAVSGAEALIRWNHPTKGFVSPMDFLPLAQDLNLMKELDKWVIKRAIKDLEIFTANDITTKIAVNLSADSISSLATIDFINASLKEAGMEHDMLSFEITESSLMSDVNISKQVIANLSVNGSQIAIDDFGTGYSSMQYLMRYPSDYLKIDKEFIKDVSTSRNHSIMVSNIIKMGHSLGMKIIAEGIETKCEQDILKEMDCDIIQGYFFSRPISRTNFQQFIKSYKENN